MINKHVYSSAVFEVNNLEEAKAIILTPEGGTTAERWEKETPVVVNRILENCALSDKSVFLDYGCGIGRIAKGLIDATGCFVVGVDISASMRALAAAYVDCDRFLACAPAALPYLGVKFDAACAIWVLQHCMAPHTDITRIRESLKLGGRLCVLNNCVRAVPTISGQWVNDGIDIDRLLQDRGFDSASSKSQLPVEVCPPLVYQHTYWKVYSA